MFFSVKLSFLLVVLDFLSAFPVGFTIQILSFRTGSFEERRFYSKLTLLQHVLIHLILCCCSLVYVFLICISTSDTIGGKKGSTCAFFFLLQLTSRHDYVKTVKYQSRRSKETNVYASQFLGYALKGAVLSDSLLSFFLPMTTCKL